MSMSTDGGGVNDEFRDQDIPSELVAEAVAIMRSVEGADSLSDEDATTLTRAIRHEIVAEAVAIIEHAIAESSKLADTPESSKSVSTQPTDSTELRPVGLTEGADVFSWRDQEKYSAEFVRLTGLSDEDATILIRAIRGGWGWTLF